MNSVYEKLIEYSLGIALNKRYTISQMKEKMAKFLQSNEGGDGGERKDFKQEIKQAIQRLEDLAYLDDAKYAKDFINDRVRFKPRGKSLIRYELIKKGVDLNIIDKSFYESEFDEIYLGQQLLSKKLPSWQKDPVIKQNQKEVRFLIGKSF